MIRLAESVPSSTPGKKPCARCGVLRWAKEAANRTHLCASCNSVLTPEEKKAWR